jgi:dsRNA-specific ribonuclease
MKAQEFTRKILWQIYGSRMKWDDLNFAYLFIPATDVDESPEWIARRLWLKSINTKEGCSDGEGELYANAEAFGERFGFPSDLTIIRERGRETRNFRFLRWRFEPLSEEEMHDLQARYSFSIDETTPPFLVVRRIPRRLNFLTPADAAKSIEQDGKYLTETELLLRPRYSTVGFASTTEVDYGLFLPSIIRHLSLAMTVSSLRVTLLTAPLATIPLQLLQAAITAPVSQERVNYQRMETLGDTVLKFVVCVQLLAEYPLWHEGYLTKKKDHSVSNFRLAKEALAKGLYRWIIRDRFLAQKWKPEYFTEHTPSLPEVKSQDDYQQLSTKMLADVGMSLMA